LHPAGVGGSGERGARPPAPTMGTTKE
jgi:hypothetical protein